MKKTNLTILNQNLHVKLNVNKRAKYYCFSTFELIHQQLGRAQWKQVPLVGRREKGANRPLPLRSQF